MKKDEKIELILLPPKEKEKVTDEDIAKFYTNLIILMSEK